MNAVIDWFNAHGQVVIGLAGLVAVVALARMDREDSDVD